MQRQDLRRGGRQGCAEPAESEVDPYDRVLIWIKFETNIYFEAIQAMLKPFYAVFDISFLCYTKFNFR